MNRKHINPLLITTILALGLLTSCSDNSSTPPAPAPKAALPPASLSIQNKINVYKELLKENPENLEALTGLGNLMMDSARYKEAIEPYQKALDITPDNVNIRVDMGTCYRNIGQPDKAAEEYQKGLTYQPNHINALANLGVVLAYDLKEYDGAVEAWQKVLTLDPNHQMAGQIRKEIERVKSLPKEAPEPR
jgi:tetratricopeptide (TPR) repeat protein